MLWRYWRMIPGRGTWAFFDRSWYGRVLVKRVEALTTPDEGGRANGEIRDFERQLTDSGVLLFKFFLHLSTDEDWRGRERWDDYADATDAMLAETHRPRAMDGGAEHLQAPRPRGGARHDRRWPGPSPRPERDRRVRSSPTRRVGAGRRPRGPAPGRGGARDARSWRHA